jgi:hypothetical protein
VKFLPASFTPLLTFTISHGSKYVPSLLALKNSQFKFLLHNRRYFGAIQCFFLNINLSSPQKKMAMGAHRTNQMYFLENKFN